MRIAMVVATSTGGVGGHVRSLCRGLVIRGHHVVVAGPASTADRFGFTAAGARFVVVDIGAGPRPTGDAAAVVRLRRLLRGADVVHAHGVRAGALCALAGLAPLIVTLHNAPPQCDGPLAALFPALERVVAWRADTVLGVSGDLVERMRRRGARRLGRAVIAAPPQGEPSRPVARVRAELGASQRRPVLLVIARLAPQKGLDILLEAAQALTGRTPVPLVAVAGDGPLRPELAAAVARRGLPVRLLGHRRDIADLLAAADVFVLPSWWEGPSLVIMEALRAGLPVVATRVGALAELYAGVARLVPSGDAAALADAIRRVLDEPGLADRMRQGSLRRAATLPGEDDAVEAALAHYRRLAHSAAARSS
ncbi:glycosyltransferase family 4 protein [Salinactinospora qingdaonensis]|uniref:glycosyltransferase family 4 protein n=1 Tax=Salinactinospora qingdaonensis TaxID=702744 RepID=UPI0031EF0A61